MARGRKRLASATHERNGSFIKDPQRRNPNEPKAIPGKPRMPKTVSADPVAAAKWKHLIGILDELGLLSRTDSDQIALYSVTWSTFVRMTAAIAEEGEAIDGKTNPKHRIQGQAADRLAKLGQDFGLNPSSRSRLSAMPKDDTDPFLEFMKRARSKN